MEGGVPSPWCVPLGCACLAWGRVPIILCRCPGASAPWAAQGGCGTCSGTMGSRRAPPPPLGSGCAGRGQAGCRYLPWGGGRGSISPCDTPQQQITGRPCLPVSPLPSLAPPLPPAHAFAQGPPGRRGGGRRQTVLGVGGGWVLAGASLNLASVECHLTQTVCASLSPYQPFCSSHLRGGGRERFGEEERSPPAPRSLASLSPPRLPLGCETPSYKSWCRLTPMLLQPPGKRGGGGQVQRWRLVPPRIASSGSAVPQFLLPAAEGLSEPLPGRSPAASAPCEPQHSCGAGEVPGLAPPQPQRRGPLPTARHISPACPSSLQPDVLAFPPGEVRAGASLPRPRWDGHRLPAPLLLPRTWTAVGDRGQLMASSHVAGSQRSPVSTRLAPLGLQQHPNGAGGAEPSQGCSIPCVRGSVLGLGLQHQSFEVWGMLECLGGTGVFGGVLEYLGGCWSIWGMLEHLEGNAGVLGGGCWSTDGDAGAFGEMLAHLGRCWSIWGDTGALGGKCWNIWGDAGAFGMGLLGHQGGAQAFGGCAVLLTALHLPQSWTPSPAVLWADGSGWGMPVHACACMCVHVCAPHACARARRVRGETLGLTAAAHRAAAFAPVGMHSQLREGTGRAAGGDGQTDGQARTATATLPPLPTTRSGSCECVISPQCLNEGQK